MGSSECLMKTQRNLVYRLRPNQHLEAFQQLKAKVIKELYSHLRYFSIIFQVPRDSRNRLHRYHIF